MSRIITVTRLKEIRKGWSYRAHYFQLVLDDRLIGRMKDGETIAFCISEKEQLLEIWPMVPGSHRVKWLAIIPGGREDYNISVSPWKGTEPAVALLSPGSAPDLSRMPFPPFFRNLIVDDLVGLENCYLVRPDGDIGKMIDQWAGEWCEGTEERNKRAFPDSSIDTMDEALTLILTENRLKYSTGGKEKVLQCCLERGIRLMLDLGDGYYQNLTTGEFFVLNIGTTWGGDPDIVHGRLAWQQILSFPSGDDQNAQAAEETEGN